MKGLAVKSLLATAGLLGNTTTANGAITAIGRILLRAARNFTAATSMTGWKRHCIMADRSAPWKGLRGYISSQEVPRPSGQTQTGSGCASPALAENFIRAGQAA